MRYEFKNAQGRVCCAGTGAPILCPACKAKAPMPSAGQWRTALKAAHLKIEPQISLFDAIRANPPQSQKTSRPRPVFMSAPRPVVAAPKPSRRETIPPQTSMFEAIRGGR